MKVKLMKFLTRAGVALLAAVMSLGLLGMTATSAQADTAWGKKIKIVVVQN